MRSYCLFGDERLADKLPVFKFFLEFQNNGEFWGIRKIFCKHRERILPKRKEGQRAGRHKSERKHGIHMTLSHFPMDVAWTTAESTTWTIHCCYLGGWWKFRSLGVPQLYFHKNLVLFHKGHWFVTMWWVMGQSSFTGNENTRSRLDPLHYTILPKRCPHRNTCHKNLSTIQHIYVSTSTYTCYKFV